MLDAVRRSLENPPANARFHDYRGRLTADGVIRRPPRTDPRRPQLKRPVCVASHVNADP
jgi:hypothetical protein